MKTKFLLPMVVIPFFLASCKRDKPVEVQADSDEAIAEAVEQAEAAATTAVEAAEEAINEVEETLDGVVIEIDYDTGASEDAPGEEAEETSGQPSNE